jgi:hypothetical protein
MLRARIAALLARLGLRSRPAELEVIEDGKVVAILSPIDGDMFWYEYAVTSIDPRNLRPYRWDYWTRRTIIRDRATGASIAFKDAAARRAAAVDPDLIGLSCPPSWSRCARSTRARCRRP